MQQKKYDIVIVGAGLGGLSLAARLADSGLKILCLEKAKLASSKNFDGRTTGLLNNSIEILEKAGVWGFAQTSAEPMTRLTIVDDNNGKSEAVTVSFDPFDIGQDMFGVNISNMALKAALLKKVKAAKNITLRDVTQVRDLIHHKQEVELTLSNGDCVSASLCVAADGRMSPMRMMAGIEVKTLDYPQTAIVCVASHELPHEGESVEFYSASGPFTLVPFEGNQSSIVWVADKNDAKDLLEMKADKFADALTQKAENRFGAMKLVSTRQSFPLSALHAKNFAKDRMVLIAEAAHGLSPIGAQGLNLTLRDVDCLARLVEEAATAGKDLGGASLIEAYESKRKLDTFSRVVGVDALNRLVSNDNFVLGKLRQAGLQAVNRVTPLRKILMQQGMQPSFF